MKKIYQCLLNVNFVTCICSSIILCYHKKQGLCNQKLKIVLGQLKLLLLTSVLDLEYYISYFYKGK